MSIIDGILGQLGGSAIEQLSGQVGAQPNQVQSAITAALPLLISAMANNTSSEGGAQALAGALDNDHNGSILSNIGALLADPNGFSGAGILKHVLGGQQEQVNRGVGQASGLSGAQIGQILITLAPLVMGYLGQMKQQNNLNASGVAQALQQETAAQHSANPDMMGLLSKLIDTNHDGNVVDDVMGMLGNFLKK